MASHDRPINLVDMPPELLPLFAKHLRLCDLADLRVTCRSVGLLATNDSISSLTVPLNQLNLAGQPSRICRLASIKNLLALKIVPHLASTAIDAAVPLSAAATEASSALAAATAPAIAASPSAIDAEAALLPTVIAGATGHGPFDMRCVGVHHSNLHQIVDSSAQLEQVRSLLVALPLLHLTHLTFSRTFLRPILCSIQCWPRLCPALAHLHLHNICNTWRRWADLWPALAALDSLRSLEVVGSCVDFSTLDQMSQLERLRLENGHSGKFVIQLGGLLALTELLLVSDSSALVTGLPSLTKMRSLAMTWSTWAPDHSDNDSELAAAVAVMDQLTRFHWRRTNDTFKPFDLCTWHPAHLVDLDLRVDMTAASIVHLRALTHLSCSALELPREGSAVALTGLLRLVVNYIDPPYAPVSRTQPMALTFPALQQMFVASWEVSDVKMLEWCAELWPEQEHVMKHLSNLHVEWLLPAVASSFTALTSLSISKLKAGDRPIIKALAERLLKFESRWGTSYDEVVRAVRECSSVTTLILRSAGPPNPPWLDYHIVALSYGRSLRDVTLTGMPQITAAGLLALASNASVEVIRVADCSQITQQHARDVFALVGRTDLDIIVTDEVASTAWQ